MTREEAVRNQIELLVSAIFKFARWEKGPVIVAKGFHLNRNTRLTVFVEKSSGRVFRNVTMLSDRKFVTKKVRR